MAKRFLYVCVGLFLLAVAYHLGANNANAQSGGAKVRLISASGPYAWVVTDNDDVYVLQQGVTTSVAHGDGWAKFRLGVLH